MKQINFVLFPLCILNLFLVNGNSAFAQYIPFIYLKPDLLGLSITGETSHIVCENGGFMNYDQNSNKAICICPIPYYGRFCELNADQRLKPDYNLCKDMTCHNNAECLTYSNNERAKCKCPEYATGEYCEVLLYTPCPNLDHLCSKTNGRCIYGNKCVCNKGFTGSRCDEVLKCSEICMNGGTCYLNSSFQSACICPVGYTGSHCEYPIKRNSTHEPCKYLVKIKNTGAYVARFSVSYIFIGDTAQLELHRSFEDVRIFLEVFDGFTWHIIHEDKNLGLTTECSKCYKFWGTIGCPKWDYYIC